MIAQILELLSTNDFYGESELIEIAKGRNKLYSSVKDIAKQQKRKKEWAKLKGR